jgi:hypothetical protein
MNLKFCTKHDQQLYRALTSRSLSEFGWRTDSERKEALTEQAVGRYTRTNFNPFVLAWIEISAFAGDKLGDAAEGCPMCLLGSSTIIDEVADKMAETIKSLPN